MPIFSLNIDRFWHEFYLVVVLLDSLHTEALCFDRSCLPFSQGLSGMGISVGGGSGGALLVVFGSHAIEKHSLYKR